jgi:hypothetical protein
MKDVMWTIIDKNTEEPQEEVLCIGFQNELNVGWLSKNSGDWYCDGEGCDLDSVTAFIKVSDLQALFKQQTTKTK